MIDLSLFKCEEREAIAELQRRIGYLIPRDIEDDTSIFYRFLKARDFNLDKAEKMLNKHLIWRKANQTQSLVKDFKTKEFFHKYIEPSTFGFDKEGDIIKFFPIGKIDARETFKCCTLNDGVKHVLWHCERTYVYLKERIKVEGRFSQSFVIVDLDKLTFSNTTNKLSAEIMLRLLHLLQDNYPEAMKCVFVINAPAYYVYVYSILKVFMSKAMIQKIQIYGSNGWKDKLLGYIDANTLPAFLGGNRTDPDGNPLCKTFVVHGGKIPDCYHLTPEDRYFKDKSRIIHLVVPPSSKREVYVDLLEEDSHIHWEFLVKSKDIGFGIFFKESDGMTELLPIQKYDTVDGTEVGFYKAKSLGKYVIVFDNTFSWLNLKEVEYCITIKHEI